MNVANVIVLAKDDRVRRQIELYLSEIDVNDLHFATFKTHQEFQELYFRERQPDPPETAEAKSDEPATEGAELKLFSEVNLLIFALDTIDGKPGAWIDRLRANLRKYKSFPAGSELRTVLLKYEDDGISKLDVIHPHLDDLVYLPLDRLVFLQKLQILLELPKRATPTYLFNQEVKQRIEISKIAKLDRLSDVALAIRNPVPLKKGVPGHFYLNLPGEKSRLEIKGKVLRSEPHPDHPGQFLVYFTYFGLSKNGLSQVRRALAKAPQYKSLLSDDRERFRYKPDDLFVEDSDRHIFGTAIIDSDEVTGNNLAQVLNKEMDRLNVVTESSYLLFLHRYLDAGGGANADTTPPKATEATDFYADPVSLTISATDLKCLTVDPGPTESDLFLGHPAAPIFSSPDKWLSLIQEKESRLIMDEAVQLVQKGRTLEKLLAMQDATNHRCAVNFKIYKGAADGTVTVEIKPASLSDIVAKLNSEARTHEIEALIVDASFVPEDPISWIDGLRMRAAQVGLIKNPGELKFWLLQESEEVSSNYLNCPDFLGLFIKPADQRQILFSLSENLPNKHTPYRFDNLGWSRPTLNIHVSKEVDLEALSEYGATLRSTQKIVPGSMVYLRRSIYVHAPNACLAAKVYACEESQDEKGVYRIYTTYFGINDQFLKFARTWIRENYALQKSKD